MRTPTAVVTLLVATALSLAPVARAADDDKPVSYLADLRRADGKPVEKTAEGVRVRGPHDGAGRAVTQAKIAVPFTVTVVAKTDSTNLRLYFGDRGVVILNWEINAAELRHHDPRSGRESAVGGAGAIPKNTWVTVAWTIDPRQSTVTVDGVERAKFRGDYAGLTAPVGVGTFAGATVTLKSLTVRPRKVDEIRDGGGGSPTDAPAESTSNGPVEVSVPAAQPKAGEASPKPPADPHAIERPEYRDRPKALVKSLSSVTSMMVVIGDDGQATGFTSDIIATVPPQSRRGDKAGAGFARIDGDEMMRTAFQEAVRAVTLRYPLWEPGHLDISFGEKFTGHGGPSAGTAFALLLLSALEGFEIDPACAVTGDITVDWKVRKVGGVTAKLRGAALDKCKLAAIPEANEGAVADAAVLFGDASLWEIQVFSIATLQQAIDVARRDRPAKLAEAVRRFDDLRPQIAKAGRAFLAKATTRDELKAILVLAPNHLSARYLLAMGEGTFPRTLSVNATMYQISVLFYPYRQLIAAGRKIDRGSLPAHVTAIARKRLNTLRGMAHKDVQGLVADVAAFIEAVDGFAAGSVSSQKVVARAEALDAMFAKLGSDPKFVEKAVREAY